MPIYKDKVFYCQDGKRHYVRSEDHLRAYGLSLNDVRIVPDDEFANTRWLEPAAAVAR